MSNRMRFYKGKDNFWLLISAGAFLLLTASLEWEKLLITVCSIGALSLLVLKNDTQKIILSQNSRKCRRELLLAIVILVSFSYTFWDNWVHSSKVGSIAESLHLPVPMLVGFTGLLLAAASVPFVTVALHLLRHVPADANNIHIQQPKVVFLCTLTAVGAITVCSKSSFLYPLNDWVDANCFFTVGKSMMEGIVVYRDLWEQKGPFLYFLHGLASLISDDSFIGVYFLELFAAFFFLYFSYQSVRLFIKDSYALLVIPILSAVVYTSPAFCHGDSAEELCLPILAWTLFVSLRSLREERAITNREYLLVGIGSGLVFWTKYTMIGFYLGWYLVPALLFVKNKQWRMLWESVGAVAAGVGIATAPFVLYFGIHHAILDWLEVYLYNNLFLYTVNETGSTSAGLIHNLVSGYAFSLKSGFSLVVCTLLGSLWLVLSAERKIYFHFLSVVLFTFVLTFMGGRQYDYYAFSLSVFVPYGIIAALCWFIQVGTGLRALMDRKETAIVLTAVCVAFCVMRTQNRYMMGLDKEELPQYQFQKIISQKENPTLLNYGFLDGGFYTVCNILPHCKAFCTLNIPLAEMHEMQKTYIQNGLSDFVVVMDYQLDNAEQYTCVAESQFRNKQGSIHTYYLYQLKQQLIHE